MPPLSPRGHKMRLDLYLVTAGLARSRTEAADLISEGAVSVSGRVRTKPAFAVDEALPPEEVVISRAAHPYVSRGGEKLAAALSAFSLNPAGCDALDVGASSGGFTDCLLQHGAARVIALDVGEGQLVPSLRADARVHSIEHYNARFLRREDLPFVPSFAVMDVSFISQTAILPALAEVLPEGAVLVSLIKPQFEVGREGIGKGGIVRDDKLRREAVARVVSFAADLRLSHIGTIDSPILGKDGNKEFLAAFLRR